MQSLNLRQIEVFRAVMITGSISGASQLLLVSQPAVSRMLSHTEQRIGFQLFERIKGRLYPSPEARRLFHDVENVYRNVQRVNNTLQDLAQQRQGVVRVVCSPSLGHGLVPSAIAAFRQRHARVRVSFECLRHTLLRERILDQQADLGISLFPIDHPNISTLPLHDMHMTVICPADHPLAQARSSAPTLERMADFPLVGYGTETPFGNLVKRIFERADLPYQPMIEVDSPQHACALVSNGAGYALVDELSPRLWPRSTLAMLPLTPPERLTINLVHFSREPLSRLALGLTTELREILADAAGQSINPTLKIADKKA